MEEACFRLGFEGCWTVKKVGRGGGLVLMWMEGWRVSILSSSRGHIDARVLGPANNFSGRVTGFYGQPKTHKRHLSWDLLRRLATMDACDNWLVVGDFNETICDAEKQGRHPKSLTQMQAFVDALEECGLETVHATGHMYTWNNRRAGEENVQERLDRVVVSPNFLNNYAATRAHHVMRWESDHLPLLVYTDRPTFNRGKRGRHKPRFHFEELWADKDECEEVIRDVWQIEDRCLKEKISTCADKLRQWNEEKNGNIPHKARELKQKLEMLLQAEPTEDNLKLQQVLADQHENLLYEEEVLWRQRSTITWLKKGDRNTKYFHQVAQQRGRKKYMQGIRDVHGAWQESVEDIGKAFCDCFSELFNSSGVNVSEQFNVAVQPSATHEQNNELVQPYERWEIEKALKQMHPTKAPGPDGMSALFYQKYWAIVGDKVSDACLRILNQGESVQEYNSTLIALIPKKEDATSVTEYKPISLCNVMYKLIAKTVANRLKSVLPNTISEFQSAFVPNRSIHDNVVAAFETIHTISKHGKTNRKKMILKLDMAKAYDRVEWGFLEFMLRKLGFHDKFIALILNLISTVDYSILYRGIPTGTIAPSRGLRQGDPLSPYLFLLCAEGLSALLRQAEDNKRIHGAKVTRKAPPLSHLFFADDSLLFCDASLSECRELQCILKEYENASGQQVNFTKSAVSFSPHTPPDVKQEISECLGMNQVQCHARYLGLPTMTGRSKRDMFRYLKDRMTNKIQGWSGKLLSVAGKEILIKAVAQAAPSYCMGVFQLPKSICKNLNSQVANFWWGKGGKRGLHWRKWSHMCRNKLDGGLGFREFTSFNRAMLAKLVWRVHSEPDLLVAKMLKAKYFPTTDILYAQRPKEGSYIWKSMLWGRDLLKEGMIRRIGNGRTTNAIGDRWIPIQGRKRPILSSLIPANLKVSGLVTPTGDWNEELLYQYFVEDEVRAIHNIILKPTATDQDVWFFDKKGQYTVKSGYRLALTLDEEMQKLGAPSNGEATTRFWRKVWSTDIPSKIKHFIWHACNEALPTKVNLLNKGMDINTLYHRCHRRSEDTVHALWGCKSNLNFWRQSAFASWIEETWTSFGGLVDFAQEKLNKQELGCFFHLVWSVWGERNITLHGETHKSAGALLDIALKLFSEHTLFKEHSVSTKVPATPVSWKKPRQATYKLNFDGATTSSGDRCGLGAILRDDHGHLIMAVAARGPADCTAFLTELLSLREGLRACMQYGFAPSEVESDSAEVVNMVNMNSKNWGLYGHVVEDIRSMCGAMRTLSIRHLPRTANQVAHRIAKYALTCNEDESWVGNGPPWLEDLVSIDG